MHTILAPCNTRTLRLLFILRTSPHLTLSSCGQTLQYNADRLLCTSDSAPLLELSSTRNAIVGIVAKQLQAREITCIQQHASIQTGHPKSTQYAERRGPHLGQSPAPAPAPAPSRYFGVERLVYSVEQKEGDHFIFFLDLLPSTKGLTLPRSPERDLDFDEGTTRLHWLCAHHERRLLGLTLDTVACRLKHDDMGCS